MLLLSLLVCPLFLKKLYVRPMTDLFALSQSYWSYWIKLKMIIKCLRFELTALRSKEQAISYIVFSKTSFSNNKLF